MLVLSHWWSAAPREAPIDLVHYKPHASQKSQPARLVRVLRPDRHGIANRGDA